MIMALVQKGEGDRVKNNFRPEFRKITYFQSADSVGSRPIHVWYLQVDVPNTSSSWETCLGTFSSNLVDPSDQSWSADKPEKQLSTCTALLLQLLSAITTESMLLMPY